MGYLRRIWVLVALGCCPVGAQGVLSIDSGKPAQLQVEARNPFGGLVDARFRLVGRSESFSAGEGIAVPPGSYRLEANWHWGRQEETIRVGQGENYFVVHVPFLRVTDLPAYTFELVFTGLRPGCSQAVIERLAGGGRMKTAILIRGDRTAVGPLEVGTYAVQFYSKERLCGIGAFAARGSGVPVRVAVAPVE